MRTSCLMRNRDGAAAVEFALVAPVLLMTLMGIFDLAYSMYAQTMLQGSIQRAARVSTIEGSGSTIAQIDAVVTTSVRKVVPDATLGFNRRSYANFSDISVAEDFTDSNADGVCNAGEPFEDANGSGTWDTDRGVNGVGGARDAVLYTVTMTYPRAFPIASLIGLPVNVSAQATTVLRNQPYKLQQNVAKVGNCT